MLDTNILTDLIKNPGGRVKERIAIVDEANVCASIVVACGLPFYISRARSRPQNARGEI